MQKIWNPEAWPRPMHQKLPLTSAMPSAKYVLTHYPLPQKFVEYLLNICYHKECRVDLFQLTLSICSRYLNKNDKYCEPTQLLLLVSLFLASKTIGNVDGSYGTFSITELHMYSNHSFTNRDFYSMQKKICESLNFNLLQQGICDRQVKTILTMLKTITEDSFYQILCKLTQDIEYIVWLYIFTKCEKQNKLLKRKQNNQQFQQLITAAIIQSSLVLCTHCVGRFPQTVWMLHLLGVKEDQLGLCVQEVLKVLLGREKFEELKI